MRISKVQIRAINVQRLEKDFRQNLERQPAEKRAKWIVNFAMANGWRARGIEIDLLHTDGAIGPHSLDYPRHQRPGAGALVSAWGLDDEHPVHRLPHGQSPTGVCGSEESRQESSYVQPRIWRTCGTLRWHSAGQLLRSAGGSRGCYCVLVRGTKAPLRESAMTCLRGPGQLQQCAVPKEALCSC